MGERGWAIATVALLAVGGTGVFALRVRDAGVPAWMRPSEEITPPAGPSKNLLVMVIDTQRIDVLGAYGSTLGASPRIDALASEGVLFETAWAQGAYTMASYMSYMTSTHVRTHGLDGNLAEAGICGWDDLTTLAEALRDEGLSTDAWVANSNLYPKKGFPRGFEHWNGLDEDGMQQRLQREQYVIGDRRVAMEAIKQISEWSGDDRHFLYLHFMAPHLPVNPSTAARKKFGIRPGPPLTLPRVQQLRKRVTEDEMAWTWDLYVAATWDGDRDVGSVLDALEQHGHAGDTAVVLLADHGEEIWEHGDYGHQDGVWEQLLHVPLIVRAPGLEPGRVSRPVALIDVAPTALSLLGVADTPPSWQGESLWKPRTTPVFAQRFDEMAVTEDGRHKAAWVWNDEPERVAERDGWADAKSRASLRRRPANLAPGWSAFDLGVDPTEQRPRASKSDALATAYGEFLHRFRTPERPPQDEPIGICERLSEDEAAEHLEVLEALGYVSD